MTREEFLKELSKKLPKVTDSKEVINNKEYKELLIKFIYNKK